MIKVHTEIDNCFIFQLQKFTDKRGFFVKTYSKTIFNKLGLSFFDSHEEFYSLSNKDVIRGFHFQRPPNDHDKIIYCTKGRILDVIVDLRRSSKTFLKHIKIDLSENSNKLVFIPKGCAHAFYTFEDDSIIMYKVNSEYSQQNDVGVNWKSFEIDWPMPSKEYIISERDNKLPLFSDFNNPF